MKTAKHAKRLSVLAAAVSLACAGSALAGERGDNEKDYDRPMTDTEYSQEQQRANDKYSDTENERADGQYSQDNKSSMSADSRASKALVADDVKSSKNLSQFVDAVEKAGLTDALRNGTQYTVFAPTDEAFKKFNAENSDLSEAELREVLRSHIVAGKVKAAQAKKLDSARVLTGKTVKIATSGDTLEIGDAKVVDADIGSENLTIHTIDTVLAANTSEQPNEMEESE